MNDEQKLVALGSERTPDFGVYFSFPKNTRNPQRLFTTAGAYINALQSLDSLLISSIDAKIQPVFVLEEIEIGSLRIWFKLLLEAIDDDALKNIDWKPAVGKYLVKGKYLLLKALEGRKGLPEREILESVAHDIHKLAQETDVRRLPAYRPVSPLELANEARKIGDSLRTLDAEDAVSFCCDDGELGILADMVITQDDITNLFSETRIVNTVEKILMVRRPDFLGEAKWDFRHDKRTMSARIADMEWLEAYHAAKVDVRPGDALRVEIQETFIYDKVGELVKEESSIIKIFGVIRSTPPEQGKLL